MTRFARAKGSKSSNERLPNEATPWCVMKQQLDDNRMMKNSQPEKTKTAKELLSEKDDPFYCDTTGNVNTDWAEFESHEKPKQKAKPQIPANGNLDSVSKKNKQKLENAPAVNGNREAQNSKDSSVSLKKQSKQQKTEVLNQESPKKEKNTNKSNEAVAASTEISSTHLESNHEENLESEKKKKKKKSVDSSSVAVPENPKKLESAEETNQESAKKKRKRKKHSKLVSATSGPEVSAAAATESSDVKEENPEKKKSLVISKRHKRNQKRIEKNAVLAAARGDKTPEEPATSGGFDAAGNDWSSDVNFGKRQKLDASERNAINGNGNAPNTFKKPPFSRQGEANNAPKRKAPKIRDDKEHKRRKPDNESYKCVINGMDVEIVKFEGFPVKKEDAERLKDLRKQMVMKGIPKSEIDGAMKLERRRAEKALARVRKQVCFHCRKAGHNLSDCPELGQEESATGICFKCGSTEHTHFECRVTKKEEFRFASCFICREQGHIAKQCPDNPKGLYPQGGACKICGDVTHLRKDCPDVTQAKEENVVTLNTIAENTLESLDEESTAKLLPADDSKKTAGKIVKF